MSQREKAASTAKKYGLGGLIKSVGKIATGGLLGSKLGRDIATKGLVGTAATRPAALGGALGMIYGSPKKKPVGDAAVGGQRSSAGAGAGRGTDTGPKRAYRKGGKVKSGC